MPVSYLDAHRIGVSRDMRLSSPSLTAAFVEGALAQGRMSSTAADRHRHALLRGREDGLDGGAQITASHNPKQYNGAKMVRQEAFPLSGEAASPKSSR
jgi:phosphomannomutase